MNPGMDLRSARFRKAREAEWDDLDRIVELDKQLRHLNRFVKDVFGVKFVVSDPVSVRRLQEALCALRWSPEQLERRGVPVTATTGMRPSSPGA